MFSAIVFITARDLVSLCLDLAPDSLKATISIRIERLEFRYYTVAIRMSSATGTNNLTIITTFTVVKRIHVP